ncbi:hypothetical protein E2F46_05285 [Luteimonas aestuarii]|uniref:Uncharacterized protein n=1 Tax=Luteimonas aestuarii TaxID=453837 RepID=A0A4R5TXU1_9GAMM|nr:hypothetical protein [Luteimonas aestuarii]TDK26016.1 hypothetical protein E2F46_05285 [Luteimonas aestuarii]
MKLSATDAALLSDCERKMVQSTGPWQVKDLVSLIKRLRDLRDKQRDLQQRQRIRSSRTTGSKDGRSGRANVRTGDKSKVLDRALKHFEAQLAKLDRESSSAMRSLGEGKAATPKKKANKGERKAARRAVKAAAGETVAKTATKKKTAKKAAVGKSTATKAVAGKAAGKKAATKKAAKPAAKGPAKAVSSKTRIKIPRSLGGAASRQRVGQASRRTRAKKTR